MPETGQEPPSAPPPPPQGIFLHQKPAQRRPPQGASQAAAGAVRPLGQGDGGRRRLRPLAGGRPRLSPLRDPGAPLRPERPLPGARPDLVVPLRPDAGRSPPAPHGSRGEIPAEGLVPRLGHRPGLPGAAAEGGGGAEGAGLQEPRRDRPGGKRFGGGEERRRFGGLEETGGEPGEETLPQEEDAHGVQPQPGFPAGIHLRHEAVPEQLGAGRPGRLPPPDRDPGEDLVPKPSQQVEEAISSRAGGGQPQPRRRAAHRPRPHPLPRELGRGRGRGGRRSPRHPTPSHLPSPRLLFPPRGHLRAAPAARL
ncbi:unnamed protein product, partial [Bubo scandiacus]